MNECSRLSGGCGRLFGGLSGFDVHLVREHADGSRHANHCRCSDWWPRCSSDAELLALGLEPDERGRWRKKALSSRSGRADSRGETPPKVMGLGAAFRSSESPIRGQNAAEAEP